MPVIQVLTRRGETFRNNTVQIAGVAVAAAIAVLAAVCIGVHFWRKRAAARRDREAWDARISAFPTVHVEITTAGTGFADGSGLPQMSQAKGNGFSRAQLTKSVIMPEKAVLRKNASKEEIVEYYAAEGKLPRPFAPFAKDSAPQILSGPPSPKDSRSSRRSTLLRPLSTASFLSVSSAYSTQSRTSALSGLDEANKRKVRQLFAPTLPDELVLSLGERVTIVNTFDDGWCVVGRDSVFAPGEVELGAVPAWVFVKPIKGLKAERPIRTSSLSVTVTMDAPALNGQRQDVISWSNFS